MTKHILVKEFYNYTLFWPLWRTKWYCIFFAVFLCIIRLFRNFAEVNLYLLLRDAVRNFLIKKSFSCIISYVKISSFIHQNSYIWCLYLYIYRAKFSTSTTVRTIIFHHPWFVQVFTGVFIVSQSFIEPIFVWPHNTKL